MRSILLVLAIAAIGCTHGGAPIASLPIVPAPEPNATAAATTTVPISSYDGRNFKYLGAWHGTIDTAAFTNTLFVDIGCKDDAQYAAALALLAHDSRSIVFRYNGLQNQAPFGYTLRPDYTECNAELFPLINNYLSRTIGLHVFDEPDSVSWGVSSAPFVPNRYNPIVDAVCAMAHTTLPSLRVGFNYGNIGPGYLVPSCVGYIAIESYDIATWQTNLGVLESLTAAPIWIVAPAYTDGSGRTTDVTVSALLESEFWYARAIDPRVEAVIYFTWEQDDTTTGDKMFYTAGGCCLPLTTALVQRVGVPK